MTKKILPTRTLPERPNLDQLRRQAKELLRERPGFALHDAQLELARRYGFESWPKLKAFVDGVTARRLAEAVQAGDLRRVRAMLKARPELVNFDMAENDEHRPIHYAVFTRNVEMTRLLMRLGADARAGIYPHRQATSALTIARERGYAELAAAIEEEERRRPKQPRARFEVETEGALTAAVKADRPVVLRALLDEGLDPNEPTRLENLEEVVASAGAPLWLCAEAGKAEMARMLLERGADPNVMVYASGSPVYSAYRSGDRAMVELLLQYGGRVTPDIVGIFGETERAREVVASGTEAEVAELLWAAADAGHAEIVGMALPRISWGREDERWYWPLMKAVESGKPECLRLVVGRCDANLRHSRFGRTVLHDLVGRVSEGGAAMATVLLDAGARMDIRDDVLRSTPLGWACRWGRVDVVRLLLERGADPVEAEADEWARPRAWAEKMDRTEVLELLGGRIVR